MTDAMPHYTPVAHRSSPPVTNCRSATTNQESAHPAPRPRRPKNPSRPGAAGNAPSLTGAVSDVVALEVDAGDLVVAHTGEIRLEVVGVCDSEEDVAAVAPMRLSPGRQRGW